MTTLAASTIRTPLTASFGLKTIKTAFAVRAERRALKSLTQHELMDIGVSIEQANIETNKSFWDFSR